MAVVFGQISNMNTAAYQVPFATQWVFGGISTLAYFCLPESPVWLVSQDRLEDAQKALQRLGTSGENMLQKIMATVAHEDEGLSETRGPPTYWECF